MPKIISIPNDNDPVMNAERHRIPQWAARHGWIFSGYNDQNDHIVQIRRLGGGASLEVLDFDCHGNPTVFNHTNINSAYQWGKNLSQTPGFTANTLIYLDACNTGLSSAFGGPIAQTLANGTGCRVYGTKGYMVGTYAEGTERCYATVNGLPPYPGAQDASGRNVWIGYSQQVQILNEQTMLGPKSLNVNSDSNDASNLSTLIDKVMSKGQVEFPALRIAPDITILYSKNFAVRVLDVFANGAILRDRESGACWRVDEMEQFQALILQKLNGNDQ